ncbi:hypothetical protein NDU88_002464 [Pleurodeles waltl]|uniref:Uncharacterized protein n=1 Tax=Pleurodeles waltl TaxID=8319 RepID=A0AAV7U9D5_PLEWA|nr:hypothetical protein NDU88_002464 [Pleurodeles waltl]
MFPCNRFIRSVLTSSTTAPACQSADFMQQTLPEKRLGTSVFRVLIYDRQWLRTVQSFFYFHLRKAQETFSDRVQIDSVVCNEGDL